jgi:hypothetical protein
MGWDGILNGVGVGVGVGEVGVRELGGKLDFGRMI